MEEGDFFVHFLDLAEEELLKKCTDINKNNLESVFEIALRGAVSLATVEFSSQLGSLPSTSHKNKPRTPRTEPTNDFIDSLSYILFPYNLTTHINHLISIMSGKVHSQSNNFQSEFHS
jgi:hypothetical protein